MKVGTGTLTLTGANTYSGGTTISGGTLLANNTSGSATGTGVVTVNSGGTLGGSGSVVGTVTVNSGGTVAPGNSAGIITIEGDYQQTVAGALEIEVGGLAAGSLHDQLFLHSAWHQVRGS